MHAPDVKATEQILRDFLRNRDVPCPNCAYNLRDQSGTQCPECGQALELTVDLRSPLLSIYRHACRGGLDLAAWPIWLSLLPLFIAFALPLLLNFLAWMPVRFAPVRDTFFSLLTTVLVVVLGTMLVIWWRQAGRMLQWSTPGRLSFVAACWLIAALVLAIFLILFQ